MSLMNDDNFAACLFKSKETQIRENFNGSNTDGSFTTAVSNSFFSP